RDPRRGAGRPGGLRRLPPEPRGPGRAPAGSHRSGARGLRCLVGGRGPAAGVRVLDRHPRPGPAEVPIVSDPTPGTEPTEPTESTEPVGPDRSADDRRTADGPVTSAEALA